MAYDPASQTDRAQLATRLHSMLATAGFVKLDGRGEHVYQYKAIAGSEILVYSSIVGNEVRGDGGDAIRVAGIWVAGVYRCKDGSTRGIFKAMRVNRTGEVDKIVERTEERMREAYRSIRDRYKPDYMCPHCGAWKFLAKSGNLVCAEACWTKK